MRTADEIIEQGEKNGSLLQGQNGEIYILDKDGNPVLVCHRDLLPNLDSMGS